LESYKPPIGIDLGNIISRAGSGAWTWVDVHNSNNNLYVPMLSTVFFSNYDSQIFGKRNNRWVLSNARTGEVILDVKFTPYFIYTFTESDYYSIQNTVEDSAGNIYEISKPAFITVVNQSIPKANDPNPLLVNSADYGFTPPNKDFQSEAADLDRSILEQQIFIRSQNVPDFGSGLNIKSDENSTFRET
jgi:PKD repeat protein